MLLGEGGGSIAVELVETSACVFLHFLDSIFVFSIVTYWYFWCKQ